MAENYSNIDDLILSFLKDEISWKEKKILEDWLASAPSNKTYFKQIYKIWNTIDLIKEDENEADHVLQNIRFMLKNKDIIPHKRLSGTRTSVYSLGKWAAVVFISLCTGAFLYSHLGKEASFLNQQKSYNEITVPMGSKSKIHLPDGTEVTLNAGSKLTYHTDYGKVLREVDFSGEGYFKVAKHKDKPFIVHTSNANIKALGTEFNVKAYDEENTIETILVEGSVVVNEINLSKSTNIKNEKNNVILKPGQKLQIFKNFRNKQTNNSGDIGNHRASNSINSIHTSSLFNIEDADTQIETSWKEKSWIVRGINLEDLAVLFSRKFNITIRLKDMELKKYKFSGIINNETVEQVFNIMKFTIPISYTIDKGEVIWMLDHNREKDYKEAY
jgi:ferric-dicitrate binding protein FerR (iron transport regulator)